MVSCTCIFALECLRGVDDSVTCETCSRRRCFLRIPVQQEGGDIGTQLVQNWVDFRG